MIRRDKDLKALERELRAERTAPSRGLERAVLELTASRRRAGLRPGVRVAVVGALSTAFLLTAGILGATSYAGSGGGGNSQAKVEHDNAADSQYDEKVIICHRVGRAANTLRLSREGAKAHLREHSGDYAGPCA